MNPDQATERFLQAMEVRCGGFPPCSIGGNTWTKDIIDVTKDVGDPRTIKGTQKGYQRGFIMRDGSIREVTTPTHYDSVVKVPGVTKYYRDHVRKTCKNGGYCITGTFMSKTGIMRLNIGESKKNPGTFNIDAETECCPSKNQISTLNAMIQSYIYDGKKVNLNMDIGEVNCSKKDANCSMKSLERNDIKTTNELRPLARLSRR